MLPILLDPATTFKSEEALSYSLGKMFLHNVLNFNPKLSSKISAIQIEDQKLRAKEQGKGAVRGGGGGGGGSAGGGKWSIEQIAFADSIKLLVKSPSFLIRILSTISGELPTPDSKVIYRIGSI